MLQDGVITVLGTMSGTSLDGVDAAVLQTDGVQIAGFGPSAYRPYSADEQAVLKAHLGRWQDADCSAAAQIVEDAHIALMQPFEGIQLAGFHGQTLAHDPGGRGTHQCGDGVRLATALGYPVAWDFRSADVAAGGQGAPLAPFYHFALAKWIKAEAPVAFLNLGGVGNITWVNPACDAPTDPAALLAFDTGPANAPMNDLMRVRQGVEYDAGGALAAQGQADTGILSDFMAHPYFGNPAPKSLDRDAFAGLSKAVADLPDADALATLAAAVVQSVVAACALCPTLPAQLLVTGGGRHNKTVMSGLAQALPCDVIAVEEVGLDGDMLEAQAFAYLAVRTARGYALSSPQTTGVPAPLSGGRLTP
ncbi:anhydro-N-acetylmuramic acid kinase [Loktanella sp. 5RATIMAR09]|uniref:anhydro-N-acetylmuramic acid kinase n=1 Tax=Loktanella sp. 5RATIMAR09 TaxID=1225655 RepID=UPI0006EB980A|nr:anhydro-N-acetylmuramic acid kinase [Loktanella sp. 5RATIMAR09]KQI73169.1 anhydro-N-acetylmuramic acid kinase [Loktanella sp. 5RATIMAR09]